MGSSDPGNFFRSLKFSVNTLNTVPDAFGSPYGSFPSLKDLYYKDRYGNLTNEKLNTFEEIVNYCKDKDIIVSLDIKVSDINDPIIKNEYLEAIKLSLEISKSNNFLHKIIYKPGSAGQVTVSEIKNYLLGYNLWDAFSKQTNVVLINVMGNLFPLATNKAYLDAWLSLPSLIGVEHIYKNSSDELLQKKPEFGNKSIVEYTKSKGIRTGVFHSAPTDELGAAGGRGNYYNPSSFSINDVRGNLEFIFGVDSSNFPSMIVTDRPDVDQKFLELFQLNSKFTKRSGLY